MSLRSPLSRVTGLGSAGDGVGHWWLQRVTSVALIPLTLWFVISVLGQELSSYTAMHAWLGNLWHATFTLLLVIATAWHSQLGLQVFIEDYVHGHGAKITALLTSKFIHLLAAAAAIIAILRLALTS
jgi:succinate dehydrogenase / fumarate reductase, membrane anchor subunit